MSGFSIFGTLGTDSNVYRYTNKVPIFDLGLRLADVEAMSLLAEPFATNKDWRAVSETLKRHGATPAEIAFLANERVELNAMTSDEFIAFIERKFAEHGVAKVVPDSDVIERHARNVIEGRLIENVVATFSPKIKEQAAAVALPENLRQQIEAELKETPTLSWDEAAANLVADLADGDE